MRFFSILATAASLLTSYVAAQNAPLAITAPLGGTFAAGDQVTITWTPTAASTVMLQLRFGSNTGNLATGAPVAANAPNTGSYTWTVPADIVSTTYSIQITDGAGVTNYSPVLTITGGTGVMPVSSAAAPSSTISAKTTTLNTATSTTSGSAKSSTSGSSSSSSSGSKSATSGSPSSTSSAASKATGAPNTGGASKAGNGGSLAAVLGLGALIALA